MANALADPRVDMLYAHGTPKDADFEVLEAASQWKLLMERAYGAPRYDSYFQKHYQLTRAVWNRERNLPPTFIFRDCGPMRFQICGTSGVLRNSKCTRRGEREPQVTLAVEALLLDRDDPRRVPDLRRDPREEPGAQRVDRLRAEQR